MAKSKEDIIKMLTGKEVEPKSPKKTKNVKVSDKKDEKPVITEPQLTEKQRRFAELVAHGVKKEDAYISVYTVSESTKASTINNNARKLINNVEVMKEIDRQKDIINITQSIDQIPDEKRLELLTGETDLQEIEDGEWNAKVAFKKLSALLKSCEESLVILKERPTLFAKVESLIDDVRANMDQGDEDNKMLFDKMDAIHTVVYKLGAFDVKEYNSTISTANTIMRALNDITGVTKNATQIENEAFERKLLTLIDNMDTRANKGTKSLKKEMEDFAFDE